MQNRDDGFSLIESLVAIAVLAGTVSTIMIIVTGNTQRSADALARLRAVFAADAIINRVGLDIPLTPQSLAGRLRDGSTWSLDIRRYTEPDFPAELNSRLLAVAVEVTPGREAKDGIQLRTLKRIGY